MVPAWPGTCMDMNLCKTAEFTQEDLLKEALASDTTTFVNQGASMRMHIMYDAWVLQLCGCFELPQIQAAYFASR